MLSPARYKRNHNYIETLLRKKRAGIHHGLAMKAEIDRLTEALTALGKEPFQGDSRNDFIRETIKAGKDWEAEWRAALDRSFSEPLQRYNGEPAPPQETAEAVAV